MNLTQSFRHLNFSTARERGQGYTYVPASLFSRD